MQSTETRSEQCSFPMHPPSRLNTKAADTSSNAAASSCHSRSVAAPQVDDRAAEHHLQYAFTNSSDPSLRQQVADSGSSGSSNRRVDRELEITAFYYFNDERTKRNCKIRVREVPHRQQTAGSAEPVVALDERQAVRNNPYPVDNGQFWIYNSEKDDYLPLTGTVLVNKNEPVQILVKGSVPDQNPHRPSMQSCHSQIPQVHQPPMMDYPPMMPPTFTHPIMQPGIPKMYMQQQQKLYHPYGDYNSGYACANLCQSMNGVNDYADARQSTTSMPPQLTQNHNMRPYSGPYMGNTPSMCPPNLNNEMYFPDNPLPSSTVDSSTCYGANTDFFENASQSSKSTRGVLYESTQQNLGYVVKSRGKTSRRRDNADLSVMSQDISAVSSSTESVLKMDNNRRECPINCIDMIIDMTKVRDAQLKTVLIDNNFYITRMSGEFIKAGLKQLDCILRIDEFSFTEALNFQSCEEKIDEFLREKKIFEISIGRLTDPKSIEMLVKLYNQPPMDSISTAPPQDHESSFALPRTNNENNHNAQQFPTPNIKNPSVVANKVVTRCSSSSSKETDTGSAFSDNNPGNSSNGKESEFDFNEPFDDLNFNGGIGDIRHNITLDTSLIDIVRFMKHPESKFDLTTRSFCSIRFQNSFTGHQLLEWLLTYVKGLYDQKDAKAFAQRLMVAKLIYCPLQTKSNRGQHCVFNENSFYIFTTVLDFDRKSFARLDEIPEESSSTGVNNNPAACSNSSVASKSNKDDALSVHSAPPSNSKLNTFPSSKIQRNSTVRRSGKFSTIV